MLQKRFVLIALLLLMLTALFCHGGLSLPAHAVDKPYVIKLDGDADAEIAISSVTIDPPSASADALLALTKAKISSGGTTYYDGFANDMASLDFSPITVEADSRIVIHVEFSFDEMADNRYQGVSYRLKWIFDASAGIDMAGGDTLYSNLNINPGDTYGFSIIVENGNPPLPPSQDDLDPDNPDNETPNDNPGESGESGISNGNKKGQDVYSGIKTGDDSTPEGNDESLPLLIFSAIFLLIIICVFIRIISVERKRKIGE